jgi:hypothetical protein
MAEDPGRGGYWIWHESADASHSVPGGATVYLRRHLQVTEPVADAWLRISADDAYELYVNGKRVGSGEDWAQPQRYDLAPLLKGGEDVLGVRANNDLPGRAGVFFAGRVRYRSGKTLDFVSDKQTLAATSAAEGWEQEGADESAFSPARELAPRFGGPWGGASGVPEVDATLAGWDREWARSFAVQSTLPEPVPIPRPQRLTWRGEALQLVARGQGLVRFAASGGPQAEYCADFLRRAAGWMSGQTVAWQAPAGGPTIALSLDPKMAGPEAYAVRWDAAARSSALRHHPGDDHA